MSMVGAVLYLWTTRAFWGEGDALEGVGEAWTGTV